MSEQYTDSDEWKEWEAWLESRQSPEFVDLPDTTNTLSGELYQQVRKLHFRNFDTGQETYPDAVVCYEYKIDNHTGPEGRDGEESLRAREAAASGLYHTFGVAESEFVRRQHSGDFHPSWTVPRFMPDHYGVIAVRRHVRGDWETVVVAQEPDLNEWAKQFTGWKFFVITNEVLARQLGSMGI